MSACALGGEAHGGDPERSTACAAVEGLERGEIVGVRTFAQSGVLELRSDLADDGIGRNGLRLGLDRRRYGGDGRLGGVAGLFVARGRRRADRWLIVAGRCRRGAFGSLILARRRRSGPWRVLIGVGRRGERSSVRRRLLSSRAGRVRPARKQSSQQKDLESGTPRLVRPSRNSLVAAPRLVRARQPEPPSLSGREAILLSTVAAKPRFAPVRNRGG